MVSPNCERRPGPFDTIPRAARDYAPRLRRVAPLREVGDSLRRASPALSGGEGEPQSKRAAPLHGLAALRLRTAPAARRSAQGGHKD